MCARYDVHEARIGIGGAFSEDAHDLLSMDNKGAIDLTNNWSVGGRTRHMGVRHNFLRELKEQGLIKVIWIGTDDNCSDMRPLGVESTQTQLIDAARSACKECSF